MEVISLFKNFTIKYNWKINFRDNDEKFLKEINKNIKNKIDIIITIGAVSAGKHDYVPRIIKKFKGKVF